MKKIFLLIAMLILLHTGLSFGQAIFVPDTVLDLSDTPTTYSGSGGLCTKVNSGETALEFGSCTMAESASEITVEIDDSALSTTISTLNFNTYFSDLSSTASQANIGFNVFNPSANSATATAGNILVADGAYFDSVALGGDATIDRAGALTVIDDSHAHVITNIDSFTEAQLETQLSDVSALFTDNVTGDVTISGSTSTIGANTVALTTDTTGNYAAGDAEAGSALSGDSATSFFSSGTIEHERGGMEADISAYDGLIGITGGSAYNQTGTTTQIIIFDGAGAPTSAALSGDATMTNGGVVTVVDDLHNHVITNIDSFTEAQLQTQLSDVTDVFTNNDGTLADDDLSDDSLSALSDVNSATISPGYMLVADGSNYQSVTMSGSCTIDGNGVISCAGGGASTLTDLADVNTATVTAGNVLVADGSNWQSSGIIQVRTGALYLTNEDCTGNSNSGALTAQADGKVVCSDDDGGAGGGDNVTVNSTAADTTANFLDGDIDFTLVDGGAGGPDDVTATVACTDCIEVGEVDFINSATVTAGNLLVASGADFHSVAMSGDATISSAGALTVIDDSHAHIITNIDSFTEAQLQTQLSDVTDVFTNNDGALADDDLSDDSLSALSDVNSSTATTGYMLVANGTNYNAVTMSGSCTLDNNGAISCSGGGSTQLTDLADVSSATTTAGRILIADGSNFHSIALGTDATIDQAGALSLATDSVDVNEVAFVNVATQSAGFLLVSDGTDYRSFHTVLVNDDGSMTVTGNGAASTFETGLRPDLVTGDPCGDATAFPIGSIFYNSTSNYHCFCNGSNADIKMNDNTTACF